MAEKAFYQDTTYLDDWKKEIDDEAINKDILKKVYEKGRYNKILDAGTGAGAQIRRVIDQDLVKAGGEIIGLDLDKDGLKNSINSFRRWVRKKGYKINVIESGAELELEIKGKRKYNIKMYQGSVYDLGTKKLSHVGFKFDLVTGLALLEHTEMSKALKSIKRVMKKGAYLHLLCNYDQNTVFGPIKQKDRKRDNNLMQLFNYNAIDNQHKGGVEYGNSQCGSLLPQYCNSAGFKIVSYGSSDWVIPPGKAINYTKNKKSILNFFVDTFYKVFKSADSKTKKEFNVKDKDIKDWYNLRKRQLSSGDLYFSCMQKDILCLNK